MNQYISESEAQIKFGNPKRPIEPGQYELYGEFEGGVFDPKLHAFDMKPMGVWSVKLVVVEDFYFEHGNGD